MARAGCLLRVIGRGLLVAAAVCAAASPLGALAARRSLDCSNTYGGASLSTIENICAQLADEKMYEASLQSQNPLIGLEIIETCACALINHDIAWASLMTHENEILFLSIKQFVDQQDEREQTPEGGASAGNSKEPKRPSRKSNILFQGPDGERRYYWDRLDDILRNANGENDDEDISLMIRENFSKIYYDPATFRAKYNTPMLMQSQKLRTIISDACKSILGKFAVPLLKFFDRLSRLSDNDRLFFALTSYNEDLYKIRLNTKTCFYLMEKGQLVN